MRKKYFRLAAFYLIISAVLFPVSLNMSGCRNSGVIEENKFIRIYTDIIIARDTAGTEAQKGKELLKQVLVRYKVSEKDYNRTIDYYNKDPERWRKFFSKAVQYAEGLKKKKNGI